MRRGLAYVKRGKTRQAMNVAKKLHALRYSGGFEIEAQALARDGLKDEAIMILQKGVEAAPTSWLNGNLLGNYLSDQGRYDEAFASYEAMLKVPSADRALIEGNYAVALRRAGREDEARSKIDAILQQDLSEVAPEVREFVKELAEEE
jgi:tetratricopeptide (TPR) repeat protein